MITTCPECNVLTPPGLLLCYCTPSPKPEKKITWLQRIFSWFKPA